MLASAIAGVAPRRRDLDFQLFEVLDVDALLRLPHFAEHDRATLAGVLDTAYEIAAEAYAPSAAELDAFPFRLVDGNVATPQSLKTALRCGCTAARGCGCSSTRSRGTSRRRATPRALALERDALAAATDELLRVTRTLLEAQLALGPERALAEATAYLDAFGTIAVAWRWLVQARVSAAAPPDDFYAGKLAACRYFFRYELPPAVAALRRLAALDDLIFTVRPEML